MTTQTNNTGDPGDWINPEDPEDWIPLMELAHTSFSPSVETEIKKQSYVNVIKSTNPSTLQEQSCSLLVDEKGVPKALHLWDIVLSHLTSFYQSNKAHPYRFKKTNINMRPKVLMSICRTFNNLPSLRARFIPLILNKSMRIRFRPIGLPYIRNIYNIDLVTINCVKARLNHGASNRLFGMTWVCAPRIPNYYVWSRPDFPVWFFTRHDILITEENDFLPKLKIPLYTHKRLYNSSGTGVNVEKHLSKEQLHWKKECLTTNLSNNKGNYFLLVLGSPWNLYEMSNQNYLDVKKVEPIGKMSACKICYLIYRLKPIWRYRIVLKSDLHGKIPINFRTNVFTK